MPLLQPTLPSTLLLLIPLPPSSNSWRRWHRWHGATKQSQRTTAFSKHWHNLFQCPFRLRLALRSQMYFLLPIVVQRIFLNRPAYQSQRASPCPARLVSKTGKRGTACLIQRWMVRSPTAKAQNTLPMCACVINEAMYLWQRL